MKHADKPMRRNQRFFNKVSLHYQDLIREKASQNLVHVRKAIVEPLIGERALDVGNGGERGFYPKQTSFYVGVDLSLEMLRRGEDRTYYKVCGEAMNLPFKGAGFNTILYLYLLHHLAKGSKGATMEAVKKALREGSGCLKTGGNVIIAETCLPSFLEKVERAFFFILRALLFFTRQSEVFFFSAETLTRILNECGYREIKTWRISGGEGNPWEWVRISIAFPILKIPRWMNPSRSMIFEARN
jgi:ubiquinone/menaquinone biosynthesis C-methylase UbiE